MLLHGHVCVNRQSGWTRILSSWARTLSSLRRCQRAVGAMKVSLLPILTAVPGWVRKRRRNRGRTGLAPCRDAAFGARRVNRPAACGSAGSPEAFVPHGHGQRRLAHIVA
jgi:hypothetical protein